MTVNARGLMGEDHPLSIGASASLAPVRTLIADADVVLAIGTELGSTDYDFNEDGGFDIPGTLIRIDVDAQQLVRNCRPDIPLLGDAVHGVDALLRNLSNQQAKRTQGAGPVRALRCREQVHAALDTRYSRYLSLLNVIRDSHAQVTIVGDSTQIIYAGNSAFDGSGPGRYFNSATGFGTLGYALPAAIGAALADPSQPVVAIVGDGGLQFSNSELATAVDAGVNITLIVHDNGGYGEIARFMRVADIEPVGVDLLVPDICMLAQAYGWQTRRLVKLADLPDGLAAAYAEAGPTLLLIRDDVFDQ
jgi:acetolactate synthase-1/2/3 large subunit